MTEAERVAAWLQDAGQVHRDLVPSAQTIIEAAARMTGALRAGRKVIWFGNGGSATQSQHMAAEFVGRFVRERRALPSIALTENIASLTAIANDYRYDLVFVRQLEGLSQRGDVAVGLSTSGQSGNVVGGLRRARELGVYAIGLTGAACPPAFREACDLCLAVPTRETARIQEAHLTIGHILCGLVDDALASDARPA